MKKSSAIYLYLSIFLTTLLPLISTAASSSSAPINLNANYIWHADSIYAVDPIFTHISAAPGTKSSSVGNDYFFNSLPHIEILNKLWEFHLTKKCQGQATSQKLELRPMNLLGIGYAIRGADSELRSQRFSATLLHIDPSYSKDFNMMLATAYSAFSVHKSNGKIDRIQYREYAYNKDRGGVTKYNSVFIECGENKINLGGRPDPNSID